MNTEFTEHISCPLCGNAGMVPSWFGSVEFNERTFEYKECTSCRSLICCPMPDSETLLEMYGNSYFATRTDDNMEKSGKSKFEGVLEFLQSRPAGVLIDYGCGHGSLLTAAAEIGWRPIGVEFSPEKIHELSERLNFEIIGTDGKPSEKADVLHLGDVIEHLTQINEQMPRILELLKDGGVLIAHGPLEANPSFFNLVLKFARKLSRSKRTRLPPYHVILATTFGQLALFDRMSLEPVRYIVSESAFPAPEKLSRQVLGSPRQTALFVVRQISSVLAKIMGLHKRGNRYLYFGKNQNATTSIDREMACPD